jgi:hypothetical protein
LAASTSASPPSVVVGGTAASTTSAEKLAPNDIALFALGGRLFAHRFVGSRVGKNGRSLLEFCGDAATQSDPLIDGDAVIGLVLRIESPMPPSPRHWWTSTFRKNRPT